MVDVDRGDRAAGCDRQYQQRQRVAPPRPRSPGPNPAPGSCNGEQFENHGRPRAAQTIHANVPPARANHSPGSGFRPGRQPSRGRAKTRLNNSGAAGGLDRLDEDLAFGVLAHFGFQPEQAGHELRKPRVLGPPLVEHPAECRRPGHLGGAGPVHGDVAMPLQQAHHPRDLRQRNLLFRVASIPITPASSNGTRGRPATSTIPAGGFGESRRIGLQGLE